MAENEQKPPIIVKISDDMAAGLIEDGYKEDGVYYAQFIRQKDRPDLIDTIFDVVIFEEGHEQTLLYTDTFDYNDIIEYAEDLLEFNDEIIEIPLKTCDEGVQTIYAYIKCYKTPLLTFRYAESDEGIFYLRLFKAIDEDEPLFIQGIFIPHSGLETNNHCVEAGLLTEDGIGLCGTNLVDYDDLIDDFMAEIDDDDIVSVFE